MKKLITIFLILFTCAGISSYAQTFPVSASTQLTPPYSIYLADYVAPGSNRLALNIFLGDINRPELQTRLRLRIEGQGIVIETKAEYLPPPLILQGGVPERLISTDLAEYFRPENLNFQGITRQQFERTGTLPEGLYQFCFEVLEYNRGVTISNSACSMAWLILNDPPLINLPGQGEKVRPQEPQFVTFQWTPRHTGSPNSAFTTEYDFSLVEIWPEGRNPNDAILTTPPIFETTTQSTTLIYGPAETPLVAGRKYALRVRARSIVGVDEIDLFKNNGYSETIMFQYGDPCNPPRNIQAESTWSEGMDIGWEPLTNHTGFTVRYRQAGNANGTWYEERSLFDNVGIIDLKPSTKYEYQVAGSCAAVFSEYSAIQTITTADEIQGEYVCGLPPEDYQFDNTTPLPQLKVEDIIDAGDFRVKITSVTGSAGNFSGKGVLSIPFFNNVNVEAEFTNITVNDEYRMTAGSMDVKRGTVDVLPDEITDFIDELDEVLADIDDVLDDIGDGLDLADEILDGVKDLADDILDDGPFTPDEEKDLDGNTVEEYREKAKEALKDAASALAGGSSSDPDTYKEAAKKLAKAIELKRRANRLEQIYNEADTLRLVAVEFYSNEKYGFDKPQYPQHRLHYNIIFTVAGDSISIPWAATKSGEGARVSARLIASAGLPADSIAFRMDDINLSASQSGDEWAITIPPLQAGESKVVRAINIPSGETVGKLDVTSYAPLDRVVNIIPVGSAGDINEADIAAELKRVYDKAVASWQVKIGTAIDVEGYDGTLQDDEQALLSVYSEGMRDIIKAYEASVDINDDEFYLFLVDKSQTNKSGYMPRKRRYGFIYLGETSNPEQTIAHELGHGAFRLQHTFEQYPTIAGSTQNLMDYGGGIALRKYQWDLVHNPPIVIGLLEDVDEGASFVLKNYFYKTDIPPNSDSTYTFISPTGEFVVLPYDAFAVTFNFGLYGSNNYESSFVPGTLKSFSILEKDENDKVVLDEEQKPKFRKYIINPAGKYVDETGGYTNVLAQNDIRGEGMMALPYKDEVKIYRIKRPLPNYSPEGGSDVLSYDDFPNKQIDCEDGDCVAFKSTNLKLLGEQQTNFKPEVLDIVYADNPTENLIFLAKLVELGNAYPRLFQDLVTNELISDINGSCGSYKQYELNSKANVLLKKIVEEGCDCQSETAGSGSKTYTRLVCSDKPGTGYPQGERYLQGLYFYFTQSVSDASTEFQKIVQEYKGGNNDVFKTCNLNYLVEGINYINSSYITTNLDAQGVLLIISRFANELFTPGSQTASIDQEGAIIKLITYIKSSESRQFLEGLEKENLYEPTKYLFEQLFESVDDEGNFIFFKLGEPNRRKMVARLTLMMLNTPELYNERLDKTYEEFGDRIFILEHNNIFKQIGKSILYDLTEGGELNQYLTDNYATYDIDYEWKSAQRQIEVRQFQEYGWYEIKNEGGNIVKLKPFDLVVFVNNTNVSAAKSLMKNPRFTDVPLPALSLVYATEAASAETIDQSISAAIDVGSLLLSGGTLTTIKGLSKIDKMRKAFLITDMASSGLSITATMASESEENDKIRNVLQSLSAVTGVLSLGEGTLNLIKKAPNLSSKFNAAKNTAESLGNLPSKNDVEKVVETLHELSTSELTAFIKGYPSDVENSLSIVIKYLRDAVKADDADAIGKAEDVFRRIASVSKTITAGSDGTGLTRIVKLNSEATSIDITFDNASQVEVWFDVNGAVKTTTAKSFADELPSADNSLYDLITPNGLYIKFDANDGRILLGSNQGYYYAFAQVDPSDLVAAKVKFGNGIEAIKTYVLSRTAQLESLAGLKTGNIDLLGQPLELAGDKVSTVLGSYIPDIKQLFTDLGSFKNIGLGETKGGLNLLNRPDAVANSGDWWVNHNMPWLDAAIQRGDDIYLATKPAKKSDIVDDAGNLKGAFAKELNHLVDNGYKPKNISDGEWQSIKNWLGKSDTSDDINRLFTTVDDFKAAIARGDNVFYVGKHTDITPRPNGVQSHHGVNSVWMDNNYSDYNPNLAPSIYMLNDPNHNATRGVFNTWRAEMKRLQGSSSVDYTKISKEEILELAERQFDAADVPEIVREKYYSLWEDFLKTLNPD